MVVGPDGTPSGPLRSQPYFVLSHVWKKEKERIIVFLPSGILSLFSSSCCLVPCLSYIAQMGTSLSFPFSLRRKQGGMYEEGSGVILLFGRAGLGCCGCCKSNSCKFKKTRWNTRGALGWMGQDSCSVRQSIQRLARPEGGQIITFPIFFSIPGILTINHDLYHPPPLPRL